MKLEYAIVKDGSIEQYPVSPWRVSGASFPEGVTPNPQDLPEWLVEVHPTPKPEHTTDQVVEPGMPYFLSGTWKQGWVVRSANREERARNQRDAELDLLKNHPLMKSPQDARDFMDKVGLPSSAGDLAVLVHILAQKVLK